MDLELSVDEPMDKHIVTNLLLDGTDVSYNLCYCSCELLNCKCDRNSLTKSLVQEILNYFELNDLQKSVERGIRLNAIHLWGVSNMSTNDIKDLFRDYKVNSVEWINDYSCNVVFEDSNMVFMIFKNIGEHYNVFDMIKGEKDFIWLKSKVVPAKSELLLLRFANRGDVKLHGSRKRSEFYRKYGYPDLKKTKVEWKNGLKSDDLSDERELICYNDDGLPRMKADLYEKNGVRDIRSRKPKMSERIIHKKEREFKYLDVENDLPYKPRSMLTTMSLYSDTISAKRRKVLPEHNYNVNNNRSSSANKRHHNSVNSDSIKNRLW